MFKSKLVRTQSSSTVTSTGLPVRLQLLVALFVSVMCVTIIVGLVATTTPSAAQAAKASTVSWSAPNQVVPNAVYPFVRVRGTDGDVGIAFSRSGVGVGFADAAHKYNPVLFRTAAGANHTNGTFDSAGNFYLVWQDRAGASGNYHTFLVKISPTLGFGTPVDVSAAAGQDIGLFPSVGVSSDGKIYVASEQKNAYIGVMLSTDGGNSWSNTVVAQGGRAGDTYTRLTIDPSNQPHVAFISSNDNGTTTDVAAVDYSNSTGKWSQQVQIDNLGTPQGRAFATDISSAPNGDVFAVWQEDSATTTPTEVSLAHWDHVSGKWQPEKQNISRSLNGATLGAYEPGVTVDISGAVWVGYRYADANNHNGADYVISTDNGQNFSAPAAAMLPGFYRSDATSIAYGAGNVYLVAQLADSSDIFGAWLVSTPANVGPPAATPTLAPPTAAFTPLPTPVSGVLYTYYMPFLATNYVPSGQSGSFTNYIALQNASSSQALVQVLFYDSNGNPVPTAANTCSTIAGNGECLPSNAIPSGTYGAGKVVSTQPLNVIVAEATPFGGSAYPVRDGANATLVAPFASNGNLGFNTQLTVFNAGTASTNVTVQFYDANGNLQANSTKSFSLNPLTANILNQTTSDSNLPSGFNGWATITGGNGSQLVAQVLEQNAANKFVAIANAPVAPSQPVNNAVALYAPAIYNGAFGGYVTGSNIINTGSSPATVYINYYDNTGKLSAAAPVTIKPNAIAGIFDAGNGGNGLPSGGLGAGFNGSAVVTSTNGLVVAVNEGFPNGSGVYAAGAGGRTVVGLPVIANGGYNYTTGTTILNVTDQTVTATLQYYDVNGLPVNTPQSFTIAPHASQQYFQGAAGLPASFYGSAVVTQIGGSNSLIVTTNAISAAGLFYTYTEPNPGVNNP